MSGESHHLAIYNFGIHVAPYEAGEVEGFRLREPLNFEAARRACGYVGRSGYDGVAGPESWGDQTFPRFLKGSGYDSGPSSLSLWEDIESLLAFTYSGVHAEALKNARAWNVRQSWPPLVLFWMPRGHRPGWSDGVSRLELLADEGASPAAFDFKRAFAPDASAYRIDRDRVKRLAAENASRNGALLDRLPGLPV
ncbi:DUF3291 domain-containing protein [Rhizobium halophytocola]|uniref:DUF3291 domain-containing protein n=1 Tax=Rhizobium halophytocola TaxID=735519 RepID=A0ABS4E2A2_9HYPH|nr:DUF3291 domain-containing protein [Rhizobium halophytocola]MBP1852062.1 hypothetical protein [Rhizobium halophytocola]